MWTEISRLQNRIGHAPFPGTTGAPHPAFRRVVNNSVIIPTVTELYCHPVAWASLCFSLLSVQSYNNNNDYKWLNQIIKGSGSNVWTETLTWFHPDWTKKLLKENSCFNLGRSLFLGQKTLKPWRPRLRDETGIYSHFNVWLIYYRLKDMLKTLHTAALIHAMTVLIYPPPSPLCLSHLLTSIYSHVFIYEPLIDLTGDFIFVNRIRLFIFFALTVCLSRRGDLQVSRRTLVVPGRPQARVRHHRRHAGAQDGDPHVHGRPVPWHSGVPLPQSELN